MSIPLAGFGKRRDFEEFDQGFRKAASDAASPIYRADSSTLFRNRSGSLRNRRGQVQRLATPFRWRNASLFLERPVEGADGAEARRQRNVQHGACLLGGVGQGRAGLGPAGADPDRATVGQIDGPNPPGATPRSGALTRCQRDFRANVRPTVRAAREGCRLTPSRDGRCMRP